MIKKLRSLFSANAADAVKTVIRASEAGDHERAWIALQPLLLAQANDDAAAKSILKLVDGGHLSIEHALKALAELEQSHGENLQLLSKLAEALEGARDIDDLNSPPSEHPLFQNVVNKLSDAAIEVRNTPGEAPVLTGLSTAARMTARQNDTLAEQAYQRLVDLEPENPAHHYNLGLFYKTRGRFREGLEANQRSANLRTNMDESVAWNLGICATGAGEGAIALEVWKALENKIEMGRFDLPEGGYPDCKVKLAERPLAERTAGADTPGLEETIWIERLSPAHGIVRSVLYQDLGVDYGDVVLIDGAPIVYHRYGDKEIPVFPHLATLRKRKYSFYNFAGTQDEARRIYDASEDMDSDAVIYPHTENFRIICSSCWRDPDTDHEHHEEEEKHIVTGRIAAPPDISPKHLLEQLDAVMAKREPCRLFVPDLCEQLGLNDRARFERKRFDMLQ